MLRLLGELAEIARGSETVIAFRQAASERLALALGFEGAAWGTLPIAPKPTAAFGWHMPLSYVNLVGRADIARELAPAIGNALIAHAQLELGFGPQVRRRSAVWNDVFRPCGITSVIGSAFGRDTPAPTLLSIHRERGRAFGPADASALDAVGPVLALGEALCALRERGRSIERLELTAREREITELVRHGLTNTEIARVLGISPNTVRNRLAHAFETLGVANRAELVARSFEE